MSLLGVFSARLLSKSVTKVVLTAAISALVALPATARIIGNETRPPAQNDSDLVRAVADHRNVNFVQAAGVVVSRVLPDDNNGLPHQRWYVKLSNGKEVIAIYNSDMGGRVPAKPGVVMALAGEFKMTNIGPMIHWLHRDPRNTRPDGYVIIGGVKYGNK